MIFPIPALAQVIPDGTTPTNAGTCGAVCTIDGGTVRGANLFHSFQDFNVDNGQAVRFTNPDGIVNILSRVTGDTSSNILGTLGVNGAANLFLLNPNGIIFGPNAQLDIRGSFLATTADRLLFSDGSEFSAVNPQAPPLLAINVPIGLQYGTPTPAGILSQATLAVDLGQRLALVGGSVVLDRSRLLAPGGRVELAAVGGVGTIELGNDFSLRFPATLARADVLLNAAEVNVRSFDAGDIAITAQNLDLLSGSRIRAGIAQGLGSMGSQAGDVLLDATEAIRLSEGSLISNALIDFGIGNAGTIGINTDLLSLSDRSLISADMFDFAQGNAGDIRINAADISLTDASSVQAIARGSQGSAGNILITTDTAALADNSYISADAYPNEAELRPNPKNAGTVTIQATDTITLLNGSELSAFSNLGNGGDVLIETGQFLADASDVESYGVGGQANGGDITIRATDSVTLTDPRNLFTNGARIGAFILESAGEGGRILIETGNLILQGYEISTVAGIAAGFNGGQAGNIVVRASRIVDLDNSDLSAASLGDATAGNISLDAATITAQNLSSVTSQGLQFGNAGTIDITTEQLHVLSGSNILAQSGSAGKGGDITIRAIDFVEVAGSALQSAPEFVAEVGRPVTLVSNIGASTLGAGNAGDVSIDTGRLFVRDGGQLAVSTLNGLGQAGNLTINASEFIEIEGGTELVGYDDFSLPTGASTAFLVSIVGINTRGTGDAGVLTINTGRLTIRDGGFVVASTSGTGRGGAVTINATDAVEVIGFSAQAGESPSVIEVSTTASGDAGQLSINTERLILQNGGVLFARTAGSGQAGTLNIAASESVEITGTSTTREFASGINAEVAENATGEGGNVTIATGRLSLRDGGQIVLSTLGAGMQDFGTSRL
ncbi:MAG: filamentous hemagglutinin N-terminal domain-containing protein, partial [Leptolyngbyaceae cyanobacterium SL_7_1]|nr:filamentous hemagglutinin N-terminal domain-containing protein [Leptolyngbyaceae cyanobacterium SL_7_1]